VLLSPSIHEWAAIAGDLHQAGIFGRPFRDRFTLNRDRESTWLMKTRPCTSGW
jgi:hypothetical protein